MNDLSLKVSDLAFRVKKKNILSDLSFNVRQGSVFAVVGHNGAGKTTLFHLILGLKFQTQGTISLLDESNLNPLSRRSLGYVPERPYIGLDQSLNSFLHDHAKLVGLPKAQRLLEITRVSQDVGLQNHLPFALSTFSKGMLQKTLIAQASLGAPKLYLLDEPMSGLDPEAREAVREQIVRLKNEKKTIIFSSHALDDVEQLADEVLILKDGKVSFLGPVNEWKRNR